MAPEVDRDVLGVLRRVGDGGQGVVYLTDKIKINRTWSAAYKEYLPGTSFDPDVLSRMVGFVPELDEGSGRWLCETTAWPAALVRTGGRVTGFLMRQIPERFRMPWGDGGADVPAAMQYLLNPEAYLKRKSIHLDYRLRLRLLESIADVMARLHSLDVVVGDMSPNNLLIDLNDPACFLIDADGMRLRGQDVLHQVETPEWHVPRPGREPIATKASDSYKFGLLAARLFAQDQMGQDVSVLAGVSGELAVMARRSLDVNSTIRPSLGDWRGALQKAVVAPLPPSRPRAPKPSTRSRPTSPQPTKPRPPWIQPQPTRPNGTAPVRGFTFPVPTGTNQYIAPVPPQPKVARPTAAVPQQRRPEDDHSVFSMVLGFAVILLGLGCVIGLIVYIVGLF
ncbi:hypothetical protein AB0J80_12030 [Actinoplanes sp. NPDC049548]|uniref:hypothetical protein n=1 Tax=Actinoplanes sp. NPDC049548 TaxID=3155152 RepID=UPI003421E85C